MDYEFTRHGLDFRARTEQDDNYEAPWQREDGHGPVRVSAHSDKRSWERPLYSDRGTFWYYDWREACRLARVDGWNAEPYDAPCRIERAVQADFDRLRRWLSNDWCYVGVVVESGDERESLWGIESDAGDYLIEVAHELADEIARQRLAAWRRTMKEARERRYWAQRDMVTA